MILSHNTVIEEEIPLERLPHPGRTVTWWDGERSKQAPSLKSTVSMEEWKNMMWKIRHTRHQPPSFLTEMGLIRSVS